MARHAKFALRFLSTQAPAPHSKYVSLNNVLGPLQTMLEKQCAVASPAWERRQRALAARAAQNPETRNGMLIRDYRILVSARGELERACLSKLRYLFFHTLLWVLILPSEHTNCLRAMNFIMISKAGAGMSKLQKKHRLPPFPVYLTVQQPELVPDLLAKSTCWFDPWSRKHMASVTLGTFESNARIVAHLALGYTCTVPEEVGNAQIRRQVANRVQTQAIDLKELSAHHIAHFYNQLSKASVRVKRPEASQDDVGNRAQAAAKKKPGSSGGAWRAFVRQQRSNDLRSVAQKYRDLSPDEKAELAAAGALATERSHAGISPFGPGSKALSKFNHARLAEAQVARFRELDADARTERVLAEASTLNRSVDETVKLMRSMDRARSRAKAKEDDDDRNALAKYGETNTPTDLAKLSGAFRNIGGAGSVLCSVPPGLAGVVSLEMDSTAIAKNAQTLFELVENRPCHHSNFFQAVDKQWSHLHRCLRGRRHEEIDSATLALGGGGVHDDEHVDPRCSKAGHCVCAGDGLNLFSFRNSILACMKVFFPAQSPSKRQMLTSGKAILRLQWVAEDSDDEARMDSWGIEPCRFFHVSEMSLNPYEPLLQELCVCDIDETLLANEAAGELALKVFPLTSWMLKL
jgi:hypothetical protein